MRWYSEFSPDAELAFSVHGQVELLLSDYHLPEATGPLTAKRFTAHKPGLRVVLMSGGNPELGEHFDCSVTGRHSRPGRAQAGLVTQYCRPT